MDTDRTFADLRARVDQALRQLAADCDLPIHAVTYHRRLDTLAAIEVEFQWRRPPPEATATVHPPDPSAIGDLKLMLAPQARAPQTTESSTDHR